MKGKTTGFSDMRGKFVLWAFSSPTPNWGSDSEQQFPSRTRRGGRQGLGRPEPERIFHQYLRSRQKVTQSEEILYQSRVTREKVQR